MARSSLSVQGLMEVLQKSGLPLGDSMQMKDATLGARDTLSQTVSDNDQVTPQLKSKYMASIQKIAAMDQKLAGVFGDPNSKMFIENPLQREQVYTKSRNLGYKEPTQISNQIDDQQDELDRQITDSLNLYKDLTSAQTKLENEAKKGKKGGKGSGGKGGLSKDEKARQKKLGIDITDDAQIFEGKARDSFLLKPVEFQKMWIRQITEGRLGSGAKPTTKGYNLDDVEKNYELYKDLNNPKKKTTGTSTENKTGGFRF